MESNPTSAYDLLYCEASEEDREKLSAAVTAILKTSAKEVEADLRLAVLKTFSDCLDRLIVNPWPDLLDENAREYALLNSVIEFIWKRMLSSNPDKISEWKMRELIRSWEKNYPEEWSKIVNKDALRELREVREFYEFQCKVNQNRY
jgi:hypothetical protein